MKLAQESMGAFEAKNKFSQLLERVGRGSEVTITKRDRPVAKLIPIRAPVKSERKRTTSELRALCKRYSLEGLSLRQLIEEGRR